MRKFSNKNSCGRFIRMSDNQISDMSPVCGQIIKNMKRRILFAKNFFLVGLLLLTSLQVIAQKARVMITTENNSKLLSETLLVSIIS